MVDKKNPNDLEQVRELIFGQQMRENKRSFDFLNNRIDELKRHLAEAQDDIQQQFKKFGKDVQKMQKDLEQAIEKARKEQSRLLETARSQILAQIDQLVQEKTDRIQLGDLLIEAGMKVKGENLLETLKKGTNAVRDD